MRLQHPIGSLAALLLTAATACASLHPGRRARLDQRDIVVYRAVAESLYVVNAPHEAVALSMSLLDTACTHATCEPVEKRWGARLPLVEPRRRRRHDGSQEVPAGARRQADVAWA
ncbi:MAG: hypothetical protein IT356_01305 [Gemmatimonadaceae bacterium]|nr:hypothetical protein [Gemmatimonadaceae bacterium]